MPKKGKRERMPHRTCLFLLVFSLLPVIVFIMALSPQTPVRPVALALLPLLLLLAGAEAYPNYYVCTPGSAGLGLPFCNSSLPTAERVADLLGRMSLPQKCAQTDDKMGAIAQLNWQG